MTQPSTRRRPQGPAGSTRRTAGFTLIELMIAVAVIGILASIAIPSYQNYVQNARRADAQSILMEIAGIAERCYTSNYSYDKCSAAEDRADSETKQSDFYSFDYDPDDSTFEVTADPKGAQSNDKCGKLSVDASGSYGASKTSCW
ncbi:type IV pilin protein [Halomonas mongoliensis]|uniref:type IV pilin protein n=1 Tax=Halomonas mongoliensis TaxID=321265 RepID=UPI00403ACB78